MSASWFLVSIYLIWILGSRLIRSNNQSRATLWVLETCLIVGLLPLIIILITASLSSNTYNKASLFSLQAEWSPALAREFATLHGNREPSWLTQARPVVTGYAKHLSQIACDDDDDDDDVDDMRAFRKIPQRTLSNCSNLLQSSKGRCKHPVTLRRLSTTSSFDAVNFCKHRIDK